MNESAAKSSRQSHHTHTRTRLSPSRDGRDRLYLREKKRRVPHLHPPQQPRAANASTHRAWFFQLPARFLPGPTPAHLPTPLPLLPVAPLSRWWRACRTATLVALRVSVCGGRQRRKRMVDDANERDMNNTRGRGRGVNHRGSLPPCENNCIFGPGVYPTFSSPVSIHTIFSRQRRLPLPPPNSITPAAPPPPLLRLAAPAAASVSSSRAPGSRWWCSPRRPRPRRRRHPWPPRRLPRLRLRRRAPSCRSLPASRAGVRPWAPRPRWGCSARPSWPRAGPWPAPRRPARGPWRRASSRQSGAPPRSRRGRCSSRRGPRRR
jgi:hypothetical protein